MEEVFKGNLFTIFRKTNEGGIVKEVCSRPPSVGVIPITESKKIILLSEKRDYLEERVWGIPWGRVDKEDDPEVAAQRELQEEAGYKADFLELFMRDFPIGSFKYDRFIYIAKGLVKSSLPQDEDEDIEVVEVTLDEAVKYAVEGNFRIDLSALAMLRLHYKVQNGMITL